MKMKSVFGRSAFLLAAMACSFSVGEDRKASPGEAEARKNTGYLSVDGMC